MNATTLYTKLSREVLNLNLDCTDEKLNDFMRHEKGFFKLRSLLLCRACRELCIEPFSSRFCQHLVCKQCLEEKLPRNPGCKWCRNEEDLADDVQSKILIGLYKQLCAILRDVVTECIAAENQPGVTVSSSGVKEKLLDFVNEGCSLPDFVISEQIFEEAVEKKPITKQTRRSNSKKIGNVPVCPPCCCNCGKASNIISDNLKTDISNDPIKVTAAQSSEERKEVYKSPEYASDNVSSTVPDSVPAENKTAPVPSDQNKYGGNKNGGKNKIKVFDDNLLKTHNNLDKTDNINETNAKDQSNISPTKFYETMNSISRKSRKNRDIFEKFGLALTPTQSKISDGSGDNDYTEKLKRKKLHQSSKEKKKKVANKEPKIQPLKLTVQKVNTQNNDVSYKIQYNISNGDETNNNERSISNRTFEQSEDHLDGSVVISDSSPDLGRKRKRKATFITNYAVFSDDSDFELDTLKIKNKRTKKPAAPKENREVCGCGAGSNVKYFTDICKRSRCPCYSQGKACVNCKCRFCSNPYLLDDEVEVIYSDSESSPNQPLSHHWTKDEYEVVDVEAM